MEARTPAPAEPVQRQIHEFVLLTAGLAVALLVLVSGFDQSVARGDALLALGCIVVFGVGERLPYLVLRRPETDAFDLDELFFVAVALIFTPAVALVVFSAGVILRHLARPRVVRKQLFNISQFVLAGGVGLGVVTLLNDIGGTGLRHVAAVLAGAAAFMVVNRGLVAWVLGLATGNRFWTIFTDDLSGWGLMGVGNVSVGLLVGLVALAHPWALPFAAAPVAMLHLSFRAYDEARQGRMRVSGLLSAAIAAHGAETGKAVERAIAAAARDLLGCEVARVQRCRPTPKQIGVGFPGERARWLVAEGRPGRPFADYDRETLGALVAIGTAALDKARLADEMRERSLRDQLTGLPNQLGLDGQGSAAIARARDQAEPVVALVCDLDDFKKVNDSLGHPAGDRLLQEAAQRATTVVPSGQVVARPGGDELTVLLTGRAAGEAESVADALVGALRRPFSVDGHEVFMSASIGVARFPDHGDGLATVIKRADAAMYRAKASGGDRAVLYTDDMDSEAERRLMREAELRRAVLAGELHLVYQPIISLERGRIHTVEALVRWDHPVLGPIGPDEFIPLAEQTGLVIELDLWVLRTAAEQARAWANAGTPVRMAVNLSGRHFRDPGTAKAIQRVLWRSGADPRMIEIEVTEGVAVDDCGTARAILAELRAVGVTVAIDDFGTGYSVLGRLQDFPVDRLKVDRSFVAAISDGSARAPLVEAIISMARSLGLGVVAEGVETDAQHQMLLRYGCEDAQGWLFGRPAAAEELTEVLVRDASVGGQTSLVAATS